MQTKKFYPEVIVRLLETPTTNRVAVLFDDGKIGEINFLNKDGSTPSSETIEKYFDMKSELYIKDNSIRKFKDEIKNDEQLMAEISKELMEKDPSIMTNPVKMMGEIEKITEEKAREIIKENSTIKEDSIIRLGGITREENGKLVLDSKTIIFEDGKPSMSGIYMYAVNNTKIPVTIKRKNGYNKIELDGTLISKEQLDRYFDHAITTLKAFANGEINSLPKPFIMFKNMSDRNQIPSDIKEAIDIINKRYDKPSKEDGQIIKDSMEKLKNFIDQYDGNFIEKLNITIPIIDNNIDYDTIKSTTLTKMLNTSLAFLKKDYDSDYLRNIAEDYFDKVIENEEIELHSFYNPPKSNCGFFPQSLGQNFIITSKVYDQILEKVNELAKNQEDISKKEGEPSV